MKWHGIVEILVLAALLSGCNYGHTSRGNSVAIGYSDDEGEDPGDVAVVAEVGHIDVNAERPEGLVEAFNDSNYVHLATAMGIGIGYPRDTRSFWYLRRPLERIRSNELYSVAELTHSEPYLVPEGARLIEDVGRAFTAEARARGLGDYRIVVTSVLRTPHHVRRLQRVNKNAVDSSVHRLGTTVDISYVKFAGCPEPTAAGVEQLKRVLADVLWEKRREGRCWVKYEVKQPCFHITAR